MIMNPFLLRIFCIKEKKKRITVTSKKIQEMRRSREVCNFRMVMPPMLFNYLSILLIELIHRQFFYCRGFVNFDIESCVNMLDAEIRRE